MFKTKLCKYCKDEFKPTTSSNLYCSEVCSKRGLIHNYYKNIYNVSLSDVEQMLEKQNFVCAICEEPGFSMNQYVRSPLNVDHNHETGEIRGLLCHNCNRGLGLFKDNSKRLRRAINYLEGATTISQESTLKSVEAHDIHRDDDIV